MTASENWVASLPILLALLCKCKYSNRALARPLPSKHTNILGMQKNRELNGQNTHSTPTGHTHRDRAIEVMLLMMMMSIEMPLCVCVSCRVHTGAMDC
uniref:Putative secreted protein n=1 Tax=Anopheles marajoara TaxID=58244 RepID=A0A2M4C982_9DIPT